MEPTDSELTETLKIRPKTYVTHVAFMNPLVNEEARNLYIDEAARVAKKWNGEGDLVIHILRIPEAMRRQIEK